MTVSFAADRTLFLDDARLRQFDALAVYKNYSDVFDLDAVPEEEHQQAARQVADLVIAALKEDSGR